MRRGIGIGEGKAKGARSDQVAASVVKGKQSFVRKEEVWNEWTSGQSPKLWCSSHRARLASELGRRSTGTREAHADAASFGAAE